MRIEYSNGEVGLILMNDWELQVLTAILAVTNYEAVQILMDAKFSTTAPTQMFCTELLMRLSLASVDKPKEVQ